MRNCVIILILLVVFSFRISAQEDFVHGKKIILNGNEYYLHVVSKGEGLYRISVNYGVSQQEILEANDDLTENIKVGQIVRIPVIKGRNSDIVSINNGAQTRTTADGQQQFIESDDYLYHTILQGQTFYSIARQYQISVQSLQEANPGVSQESLKIGYLLRIPRPDLSEKKLAQIDDSKMFTTHKVKRKETMYGISRMYHIDEITLKSLNPSVNFVNLKVGEMLKVPTDAWFAARTASVLQQPENNISITENFDYPHLDSACQNTILGYEIPVNVALMLPFSAKQSLSYYNDSLTSSADSRNAANRAKPFLEFYSGTLLAVEELKKEGININLHVYDISDSRARQSALNSNVLKSVDLIIGPGIANEIKAISDFSIENQINMVYPMSKSNPELHKNPYIFQINTPDSLYNEIITDEIINQAKGENLLVILPNSSERNALKLTNLIKNKVVTHNRFNGQNIKYLEYTPGKGDILSIQDLIDKSKHTYIVIPTENQADISKYIPVLAGITIKTKADVTLFGMREWLQCHTIDPEDIYVLNGIIFSIFAVDYNDYSTKEFIKKYRQTFNTEPFHVHSFFENPERAVSYSRHGIWGYDVTYYFIKALFKYGKNFAECLDDFNQKQIQFNFHFKRISNWGGYYNNGLYMIHFKSDYTTKLIPLNKGNFDNP